ncbi:MAG: hypothetical protein HY897_09615 [Deltaproteobacteria bacterium]|nr:hypothetical protein [Deltaproteobacteria bacterium]
MRLPLFIVVPVFFIACATVPRVPGEPLYLSKCGACHQRPGRGSFDASGWREVLEGHQSRFPLTKEEMALLSEFLAGGTGQ